MYQRWRRLLFLHWDLDPAVVQRSLPDGLTVDCWDGRAWLGLVPFAMEDVRPRFLPAIPRISSFPEMNVRTYVRDAHGRAGVWFYSLDCSQPLAVWAAKRFFGLAYFHATMREQLCQNGEIAYDCLRRGRHIAAHLKYRGSGEKTRAKAGTIEQFLVERYRLFARREGRLWTGKVWHEPYPLQQVEVLAWSSEPLQWVGFDVAGVSPGHVIFSPGVDVRVFPIERV
jgi:uncharacterized protein YqjF (DUF2071 family)